MVQQNALLFILSIALVAIIAIVGIFSLVVVSENAPRTVIREGHALMLPELPAPSEEPNTAGLLIGPCAKC